jgi:hypothetical protein
MQPHVDASATVTKYGTWFTYGGAARMVLVLVLLVAVVGVAYAGIRLNRPIRLPRPSRGARASILVLWGVSILAFLVCLSLYVSHAKQEHLLHGPPPDPIAPVTAACALATFVIIAFASRSHGQEVMVASAAIGAIVGPMIFELPFDLIVMARVYPPLPPDPALYRALFFVPLFLIELSTLALLTLTPLAKLSRPALFSFALMLLVFAIWALSGFAYPSAQLPIALNMVSKILAFVTALSLFLPRRAADGTPALASIPSPESTASEVDKVQPATP